MIYFVRAEGTQFVKIGFTSGPVEKRIASLQTGSPHRLVVELTAWCGTREHEKSLHELFADARTTGEWFELYEEDVKSVERGAWYPDDSFDDCYKILECLTNATKLHEAWAATSGGRWEEAPERWYVRSLAHRSLCVLAFKNRHARELIAPHGFSVARVCQRLVARAESGDSDWEKHAKFALRVIHSSRPLRVG